MKRCLDSLKNWAFMSFLVFCVSSFICCGDDDDEDLDKKPNSLSNNAKKFVGCWSDGKKKMFFFDDGYYLEGDKFGHLRRKDSQTYLWKYDEETGILSTTYEDRQWKVNMIGPAEWAALDLGNYGKAVSFHKANLEETVCFLLDATKWIDVENESNYVTFSSSDRSVTINLRGGIDAHFIAGYYMSNVRNTEFRESDNLISFTYKHYLENCTVLIHNPYSYWNVYLLLNFLNPNETSERPSKSLKLRREGF